MAANSDNPQPAFRLRLDQKVPMRDGIALSADIYLPLEGDCFPTLLLRTIYDNQEPRYVAWGNAFVEAGYAVVVQDCRGRYDSGGEWDPYVCETPDGYDTHEWIGAQSWCDGNIGTFGISYPGFTQTAAATQRSRYLKALVPIASQQDNYGHHRIDGIMALSTCAVFLAIWRRTLQDSIRPLLPSIHHRLPFSASLDEIANVPYIRHVIEHESYDDFWSGISLRNKYGEVDTPALFMTGWYDSLLHETLKLYNGWSKQARSEETRVDSRLLIGPWSHQIAPWGKTKLGAGGEFLDATFGPDAEGDIIAEHLRWYDVRLRGIDTGVDDDPPIKLFVMGANQWRFESEWPLARTAWKRFYLRTDGPLSEKAIPEEAATTYAYDPNNPCPSWGAQCQEAELTGPRDRRVIEAREDVLVYETEPLTEGVEVTGPASATLFVSSDAPDTDFTAALVDVHPDGRAIVLCEGICRARFRNGIDKPELMKRGETYQLQIDMWDTSNLFKVGHRIRVDVSSSNFPRYDRNLNSGGRIGFEAADAVRVARNTVRTGGPYASHVTLPVIPTG